MRCMSAFRGVLVLILLAEETAAEKQYIRCLEYESNRTGRVGVARYGGGEDGDNGHARGNGRSEEHTSELQSQ